MILDHRCIQSGSSILVWTCLANIESHKEYFPQAISPLFGKDASLIYWESWPSSAVSWKYIPIVPLFSKPSEIFTCSVLWFWTWTEVMYFGVDFITKPLHCIWDSGILLYWSPLWSTFRLILLSGQLHRPEVARIGHVLFSFFLASIHLHYHNDNNNAYHV